MRFSQLTAGWIHSSNPSGRDFFTLMNRDGKITPASATVAAVYDRRIFLLAIAWFCLILTSSVSAQTSNLTRTFSAHGTVLELNPAGQTILIRHDAIAGYMGAMTMPFKAAQPADLSRLAIGDQINFQLDVNDSESCVHDLVKTGHIEIPSAWTNVPVAVAHIPSNSLLDYKFTNELGQAVSFNDFHGQALAVTFFYTRCPVPDFCPRLSKNFQEASAKLAAQTSGPTNWHFISVSFDPEFDTPDLLKAYAGSYQADPAHWSFFTGPPDKIAALAQASGVSYQYADGTYNHNFRTLIVDPNGHLKTIIPIGGNLSDMIVDQILKTLTPTNQLALKNP